MPTTRRLRLGIDLDGVVADFNAGWVELYNAEFGAALTAHSVVTWGGPAEMTHFGTMSRFWTWARHADGGASIFRRLPLYPGAFDALQRLSTRHDIVILTSKPHFAIHDTYLWLGEQRVPTTEVHIIYDKSRVACDIYLDDADHNLRDLMARRPEAVVCRYERPWNRPRDGVIDIDGWDAFEAVVDKLATIDTVSRRSPAR